MSLLQKSFSHFLDLWPMFRLAMIKRLNRFGSRYATLHARVARRDYSVDPVGCGAMLCSRRDCLLNLEKRAHDKDSNPSSNSCWTAEASSAGGSGPSERGAGRGVKYGRYPTSSRAVDILMRALESQGIHIGGNFETQGAVGQVGAVISVADICGTPLDYICKYFDDRTDVNVYANDPHPPPTIPMLAATKSTSTLFTRLDASSASFLVDFLQATSSHTRKQYSDDGATPVLPNSILDADKIDNVITSPPYNLAEPIIHNALLLVRVLVAMKLPVNFMCPGRTLTSRRQLLAQYPPSSIIPMCKADNSALYNTRTDEAWFIWLIPSPRPCTAGNTRTIAPFIFSFTDENEGT
jgi:hypothetical protein